MRHITKILILTAVAVTIGLATSCKRDKKDNLNLPGGQTLNSSIPVSDGSTYKPTILGDQLKNPFQVDTMRKAFKKLTGVDCQLPVTHKYVRFLPATQELYDSLLMDTTLDLYDIPFDREIIELGDYYQSPGFSLEQITWQYTVVPADKTLPDYVQTEVLADLFLPNESNVVNCNTSTTVDALEEEAFKMTGNYNEYSVESVAPGNDGNRQLSRRAVRKFHPEGDIRVDNTQLGLTGVWNVKVKSRRWFNIDHTFTDASGHFRISNSYRGKVHVNLEFQSSHAAIRGIRGYRVWQIADAIDVEVGQFQNSAMESIGFIFQNNSIVTTEAKRRWMAATTCNALEEYRMMATANSVLTPHKHLNIWLTTEITINDAGSAPMLKKIGNRSLVSAWVDLKLVAAGHPGAVLIKRILTQFLPDITYGYNVSNANTLRSDNVSFVLYHEFGHASHYRQVGSSFWLTYIAYIAARLGYGGPGTFGNEIVEVSEGWAEYVGHVFAHSRYPRLVASTWQNYSEKSWRDKIENFIARPGQYPFDGGGAMFDMTETGEPISTIQDEVNAYTMAEIFQSMQFTTVSVPIFHQTVLLLNSNKQKTAVDLLYSSYGF
jgi:hypothetical protein